mgnify:CR=1 FL=1
MRNYHIDTYYKDIKKLANTVQAYEEVKSEYLKWRPDYIIGVARGGLVPSVYLSHMLGIPMKAITWQLRDGDVKESIPLYYTTQILIVDDINDSGNTFSEIIENIQMTNDLTDKAIKQNIKTAALWERSSSKFRVDFNAQKIDNNDWIIFPWELPPDASKE